MNFWRLDHPEYPSDYAHTFINGALDHPFALPGIECERCGQTWGGHTILPYGLPLHLQSLQSLTDPWPISGQAHAELRHTVLKALQVAGNPITDLPVGTVFQPAFLDVPSQPEADFLWSGLGSVVVSQRVRDAVVRAGIKGATFVSVVPRKIGMRKAKLPPPRPRTGEPEDLITEIKKAVDPDLVASYYELVVTAESKYPPGAEPHTTCELCGRETYDAAARQLVMRDDMWTGDDIFFLATTLWIVVTDSVKTLLESIRATNLMFSPVARAAEPGAI
jgi:hypothetical protein